MSLLARLVFLEHNSIDIITNFKFAVQKISVGFRVFSYYLYQFRLEMSDIFGAVHKSIAIAPYSTVRVFLAILKIIFFEINEGFMLRPNFVHSIELLQKKCVRLYMRS